MTKMELAENLSVYADKLGDVRAQKSVLEAQEKELSEYLKKHGKPGVTIHGKFYDCDLVSSSKRVISAIKAFKKLGKDKFLQICSVAIKEAQKVMSNEEIDAISEVSEGSISARTKARPRVNMPGTPGVDVSDNTIEL